jgi:nucleotide-binding universal stress UspA family protein
MAFIVVGIDGSETSREAFREAVREAKWRDASVLAVHAVSYPVVNGHQYAHIDPETFRKAGTMLLADELEKLEAEFGTFPVKVESRVLLGHTGTEMMRVAEDYEGETAELIVVGSRGLGGFRGLLLGSVTTYLVHHLPTRVLVIPSNPSSE